MKRQDLLPIGILILCTVILYRGFFLQGQPLISANAISFYPWYGAEVHGEAKPQMGMDPWNETYAYWELHDRYVDAGEMPFWNPYNLSGTAFLAGNLSVPLSIFKVPNLIFDAPTAWSWAVIIKTFLTGLFTYLILRAVNYSPTGSLIGALAWMLCKTMVNQYESTYNESIALLPLIFYFLLKCYQAEKRQRQIIYGCLATTFSGFHFLAGNIQMSAYVFLIMGVLALYWAWQHETGTILARLRPLWILLAVFVGGLLVGMVQIASTLEFLPLGIRGTTTTYSGGIPLFQSMSFFNFWIFVPGDAETRTVSYWFVRSGQYMGMMPLLALIFMLRFVRDKLAWVMGGLGLGILLFLHITDPSLGINKLLAHIPGYTTVNHNRITYLLPFMLAFPIAAGVDWLLDHTLENRQKIRRMLIVIGLLVLPFMVGSLILMRGYMQGEVEKTESLAPSFSSARIQSVTRLMADNFAPDNPVFLAGLITVTATLILTGIYAAGKVSRRGMEGLLIVLVAADLLFVTGRFVDWMPRELVYPVTPAIEFLQNQEPYFRINSAPNTLQDGRSEGLYSRYRDGDYAWFLSMAMPILRPNTAAVFGLQDIRGYESIYTLRYSQYLARVDGREQPLGVNAWLKTTITHPMLDLLNTRYILSIDLLDIDGLEQVFAGEIYIYENVKALPRVQFYADYTVLADEAAVLDALSAPDFVAGTGLYFDHDPGFSAETNQATATITRYEASRVTIQVSTPADTILVLADADYPGWEATIDGQKTDIHRANYLVRAIAVPVGEHEIEFRYRSPIVEGGLAVSVISLIVLILVGGVTFIRKK